MSTNCVALELKAILPDRPFILDVHDLCRRHPDAISLAGICLHHQRLRSHRLGYQLVGRQNDILSLGLRGDQINPTRMAGLIPYHSQKIGEKTVDLITKELLPPQELVQKLTPNSEQSAGTRLRKSPGTCYRRYYRIPQSTPLGVLTQGSTQAGQRARHGVIAPCRRMHSR